MSLRGSRTALLSRGEANMLDQLTLGVGAALRSAERLAAPLMPAVPTPPGVSARSVSRCYQVPPGDRGPGGAPLPCGHQFHVTPAATAKENRQGHQPLCH